MIIVVISFDLKGALADDEPLDLPPLPTLESNQIEENPPSNITSKPLKSPLFIERITNIFKSKEEKNPSKRTIEAPTLPIIPDITAVPSDSNNASTSQETNLKIDIPDSFNSEDISSEQSNFIIDEAKVLLLPNDEVVLGELTEAAKIDQMDFNSYIELYKSQLNLLNNYMSNNQLLKIL